MPVGKGGQIVFDATNVGGGPSVGSITVSVEVAEGLAITKTELLGGASCPVVGQAVTCTLPQRYNPSDLLQVVVSVTPEAGTVGTLVSEAQIEGGGAVPVAKALPAEISSLIPPFGFLSGESGFSAPLSSAEGQAATQAGSHPYQLTVEISLPSERPSKENCSRPSRCAT